mgnify:CR=1 FL=1
MKSLQPQAGGLPLRLAATRCLRAPQRPAPPHLTAPVVARVLRSARQLPGAPWGRSGVARRATAAPARLPLRVAAAAARSPVEVLLDGVPGKGELLSPRLDPEVRQRAERAIAARGGRVTIGAFEGWRRLLPGAPCREMVLSLSRSASCSPTLPAAR